MVGVRTFWLIIPKTGEIVKHLRVLEVRELIFLAILANGLEKRIIVLDVSEVVIAS